MDLEIEYLNNNLTKENSKKLLMEHIERMASGEAPFFSTTLSLVYDTLVEESSPQTTASGSHPGKSPGTGDQGVTGSTDHATNPASHANPPSTSTPTVTSPPSPQTSSPTLGSPSTAARLVWLECTKCGGYWGLKDLYEGVHCPRCPEMSVQEGRPRMKCRSCNVTLETERADCINRNCRARFV